jgi:acetylornithine deacetylase/succinyl-diaminopimelate desuccinylase-like protein
MGVFFIMSGETFYKIIRENQKEDVLERAEKAKKVDALELLKKLVRFESITPDTTKALDLVFDELEALGFSCKIIECFDEKKPELPAVRNLFATIGEKSPSLVFCGHTDVVPEGEGWSVPVFDAVIKDGALWGRGTEDMKGGIATFIEAVSRIENIQDYGSVSFMITGAEEAVSHNGILMLSRYLKEVESLSFDACITGEPTGVEKVGDVYKPGRRGNIDMHLSFKKDTAVQDVAKVVWALENKAYDDGFGENFPPTDCVPVGVQAGVLFDDKNSSIPVFGDEESSFVLLEIIGKQGHSGYKFKANNPIGHMLRMIKALDKDDDVEISGISSGFIAINVIPATAYVSLVVWGKRPLEKVSNILQEANQGEDIEFNVSLCGGTSYKDFDPKADINYRFNPTYDGQSLIKEAEERVKKAGMAKKTNVSISSICDSYETQKGELVSIVEEAVFEAVGYKASPSVGGGTSDSRHVVKQGVASQVVDLGFVGKTLHKPNENVPIDDIEKLVLIYEKILRKFFGVN